MFTHLQVKSGYSFYQSTITIEHLIERAKELEFGALAITDEGVLHGAIAFYQACKKHHIHPIIGLSMTLLMDNEADIRIPVVILAKNNKGYQQLMHISTIHQVQGVCAVEDIGADASDLIFIIPTETPWIKAHLLEENWDTFAKALQPIRDRGNEENVYLGVAHYNDMDNHLIETVIQFGYKAGLSVVAMQDVRYLQANDVVSYDCLLAMKNNQPWQGYTRKDSMEQRHFAPRTEMVHKFEAWPELLGNIDVIVDKCHVTFDFTQQLLPAFPVPNGNSAHAFLRETCEDNLPTKYTDTSEASRRLNHELEVIESLGFSDYFLIVADFVQYAKDNGIATGPGRGSAAGSIVAYVLGITNVDPLQYGLLFERFLNPERVTMPDIDIDFSDVRRDEVIQYVREKYGSDHVAQIITFGTFLARSLLRELMKTMDIDYRDQAYILKQLPSQRNEPLLTIIRQSDAFRDYIKQSEKLRLLFRVALKLEGLPRHMSTHAAGIVIGKQSLKRDVPLTVGANQTYLTQYPMNDLEAIGLLKMDLLGLRNLSLLERIIKTVAHQSHIDIQLEQLPEDDSKTYQLLQKGNTNGIFQLESDGMKGVLRRLQPTALEDIIAVNALYRPGPMEQIQVYIDRKHGRTPVTYLHPDLEPILAPTYGVLIYQEQIMQIAHQFAGLSLGEADVLRRAISKKNRQLIEEQKATFLKGCMSQGYAASIAEEVFHWIEKFADYGFNKSHAVAYSKIAYQLSYLKTHFPAAFFAQFLGSAMNDAQKLPLYIKEAQDIGMTILPPDINRSYAYFHVEKKNTIRIGFLAVKGIGYETANAIVKQRSKGLYADVFDFCLRVKMKRNHVETLILAGVFDTTYKNRASLLASLDQAFARADLFGDLQEGDLFKEDLQMAPAYADIADFSLMEKLRDEKELLEIYVSDHPLKSYRYKLSQLGYQTMDQIAAKQDRTSIQLIAIVERLKKIHTKRGESMAFLTVSDETNEIETVIFPSLYREISPDLKESQMIKMKGKISFRNHKQQIIADQLTPVLIDEVVRHVQSFLYIKVTIKDQESVLRFLKQLAKDHPGQTNIILYLLYENKTFKLSDAYAVHKTKEVVESLHQYFGSENIVFNE